MPRKKAEVTDIAEMIQKADEKKAKRTRKTKDVVDGKVKSAKKLTKKEKQIHQMAEITLMPAHYSMVWTEAELDECVEWLSTHDVISIDTETMGVHPWLDEIVGISFYAPHRGFYIPLKHKDNIENVEEIPTEVLDAEGNAIRAAVVGVDYVKCLSKEVVTEKLRPLIEVADKKWLGHNIKFDMHVLRNWLGLRIKPWFDTMIGAAILDENQSKKLKDLAPYYLKVEAETFGKLFGKVTFDKVPILMNPETRLGNLGGYYAIKDTELTFDLAKFQCKYLWAEKNIKLKRLVFDIEMPFLSIVAKAEERGVPLDREYLVDKVAKELHADLARLRMSIWQYTGEINLNAPAQLAEALYVKLGLPVVNPDKPRTTDKKALKMLKKYHKVIPDITEYKEKYKLTTAFADKLPKVIVNGRVHTSFNPVGARTGRMSCSSPNLQQIPSRVGGLIRNAFVADKGRLLASIDFSSQELRVLAHVSQCPVLLDVYRNNKDVHSMTGVSIWNMSHDDEEPITYDWFDYCRTMTAEFQDEDGNLIEERFSPEFLNEMFEAGKIKTVDAEAVRHQAELGIKYEKTRKSAKTVNFGIVYGMSKYKLADDLNISTDEAQSYIDAYFAQYPGVSKWMNAMRYKMKKEHFTETINGRKRRVYAEMKAPEFWKVQKGYRQGINAVIQGTSADMTKIATINLVPLLEELDVTVVLWVHDEMVFDVPENIGMENLKRIADVMCNAIPLDCGMKSDIEAGVKWGQKLSVEKLSELQLRVSFSEDSDDEEEGEDEGDAA